MRETLGLMAWNRIAIGYRLAVDVLRHCICSSRLPNTTQLRLSIDHDHNQSTEFFPSHT
jgi:hypothetical protein